VGLTAGLLDTYALGNLPASVTTVYGVQVGIQAAKAEPGDGNAKIVTRSGGTNYAPNTYSLGTSYTELTELHEVDPATSAAWTPSGVNALEVGMEVA
jgi:hypothetical protein